jgi:hypothetical protein
LKEHCKEVIRKKGLEKVTVEDLVAEITPHGRGKHPPRLLAITYIFIRKNDICIDLATVPEDVKAELLKRIRLFLQAA